MAKQLEPQLRKFGWCMDNDAYHDNCRNQYRNEYNILQTCECPKHEGEPRPIPPEKVQEEITEVPGPIAD